MAITSTQQTQIVNLYVGMFNKAPSAATLSSLATSFEGYTGNDEARLYSLADSLSTTSDYTTMMAGKVTAEAIALQLVSNAGLDAASITDSTNLAYHVYTWAVNTSNAGVNSQTIIAAYSQFINTQAHLATEPIWQNAYNKAANKAEVATYYATNGGLTDSASIISTVTEDHATVTTATAAVASAINAGTTYSLTTGTDDFTGTALNDTFVAGDIATVAAWTVGDTVTGGAGTDTLSVISAGDIAKPAGATVTGVETVNATSGLTVTLDTTSGFSGLTALNTTGVGNSTVTAAATTDINDTTSLITGGNVVNGGKDVTVTITDTATLGTASGSASTVGATTAAAGTVTATLTESVASLASGATTSASGTIGVTGGTVITVNNLATITSATVADHVGDILTIGAITVTGNASTTAVTATQTAAGAEWSAALRDTTWIKNGIVTITDGNAASASDTITAATLSNFGNSTVTSSVLSTLNLTGGGLVGAGTASGTVTLDKSAADSSTDATTLTVNMTGGFVGAIDGTLADIYTTVNVVSAAAATIADVNFAAATSVNASGAGVTTITALTDVGAVTAFTSTGGGLSLGAAIGTAVTFTGGAGADAVTLGVTTKAIDMGAGDDTVTYAGIVGTGGSVAAGTGTDTIVMTSTAAAASDATPVFNTKNTGFETLSISGAFGATDALDVDGLNNVSKVIVQGGTGSLTASQINNIDSTGTVEFRASIDGMTIGVQSAITSASDVLNINLASTTAITHGSIVSANVETININTADFATAGSDAVTHIISVLDVAAATTITVAGNNGLTITAATNSIAVTNFDASGVVANNTILTTGLSAQLATTDTAALLAVTYASLNATATAAVTITGGDGNDTLTGAAALDTIIGGAGADILSGLAGIDTLTGGEGADTLTGGAAADSIVLTETTSAADIVIFNAVEATSSDSGRVATTGSDNDSGQDTITGFTFGTDTIRVVATGITNFVHGTNTAIGTATGTVDDGTVGSFLTTTGLVDIDSTATLAIGTGDLAMNFATSSATMTEALFEAALQYTLTGAGTADTITGGGLADTLDGGAGTDTLDGGAGNDALTGGAGADTFTIGLGDDTISDLAAGNSADIVTVASGATVVATLTGNWTATSATSNLGSVAADFSILASDTEIVDLDLTTVTTAATDGFTVTSTSTGAITGSDGADTIINTSGASVIIGGAAADTITGGTGVDTVKWTGTTAALIATEVGSTAGADVDFGAATVGDKISTFTSGTDKFHFATLLVNNGTDTDTLKTIAAAGTVADNDVFVEVTTAAADGTTGAAITLLNALDTSAVAIGEDVVFFVNDGTNGYLYLLAQVSTADTIAAADITLIGQIAGVTDVANGDFVSF